MHILIKHQKRVEKHFSQNFVYFFLRNYSLLLPLLLSMQELTVVFLASEQTKVQLAIDSLPLLSVEVQRNSNDYLTMLSDLLNYLFVLHDEEDIDSTVESTATMVLVGKHLNFEHKH